MSNNLSESLCYALFYTEEANTSTVDQYGNEIAGKGYACFIDNLDDLKLQSLRTSAEEMQKTDEYLRECSDSSVFLPKIHIGKIKNLKRLEKDRDDLQKRSKEADEKLKNHILLEFGEEFVWAQNRNNEYEIDFFNQLTKYNIQYQLALKQNLEIVLNEISSPYRILHEISSKARILKDMLVTNNTPRKGRGGRKPSPRSAWIIERYNEGLSAREIGEKWNKLSRDERKRIDPKNAKKYLTEGGKITKHAVQSIQKIIDRDLKRRQGGPTVK